MAENRDRSASTKSSLGRLPIILGVVGVVAVIAVVLLSIGGEGEAPEAAPVDPHTGLSEFDIPVQDPDMVTAGQEVYEVSCSACHGLDLRGTPTGPSLLSIIYNPIHHPDDAFLSAALNGVTAHHWAFGDMTPVAGVSEEQLEQVIAYVRDDQRVQGFEAYPPQ